MQKNSFRLTAHQQTNNTSPNNTCRLFVNAMLNQQQPITKKRVGQHQSKDIPKTSYTRDLHLGLDSSREGTGPRSSELGKTSTGVHQRALQPRKRPQQTTRDVSNGLQLPSKPPSAWLVAAAGTHNACMRNSERLNHQQHISARQHVDPDVASTGVTYKR